MDEKEKVSKKAKKKAAKKAAEAASQVLASHIAWRPDDLIVASLGELALPLTQHSASYFPPSRLPPHLLGELPLRPSTILFKALVWVAWRSSSNRSLFDSTKTRSLYFRKKIL